MTKIQQILICFLLTALCSSNYVYAQSNKINGIVYDQSKAGVLVGATVILVNGSDRIVGGVLTDATGRFSMDLKDGVEIQISYLGYKPQKISSIVAGKQYEIILKEDANVIGAISVVADRSGMTDNGMLTRSTRDVTSAISKIDMKLLETQGVSSIEQLLQGAAPGMSVIFNSGDPGAGASIKIRGTSSLTGDSNPLWVIDGVEVIGEEYTVESITNFGASPVGDIDPSQIESIDVLKDAASTAIYGSRGANGVIVIRTKRGTPGKPKFSFSSKLNVTQSPRSVPMLSGDEQRIFMIESRSAKLGGDTGNFLLQLRGDLTRDDAWMYNNNTDWVDQISRTGFQQDYNFSLSGGGERLIYYWGLSYNNEYGTTIGGGYDRFSTNLNLDYRLSSKLRVTTKFSYNNSTTDRRSSAHPLTKNDQTVNPIGMARARASYFPIYNENETDYHILRPDQEGTSSSAQFNPVSIIDNTSYLTRANRFTSSVMLNYRINSKFDFNTQLSVDYRQSANDYFIPPQAIGAIAGENDYNYGTVSDGYQMKLVNKNRLSYQVVSNENHYFRATAIADVIYDVSNQVGITYSNGASPELREVDASARFEGATGSKGESSMLSLVLNAHYKFKNRYNLDVTLKTEGSSRYGDDNPYSIYPSVGFSWDMKEEAFFKHTEWIDLIKPRFSFGRSGRLPGVNNILDVAYGSGSGGYLNNSYTFISKFAYDNVHEEKTSSFNYGADWNLFSSRFSGSVDYYTSKTTDLLMPQYLGSTSGFTESWTNFGDISNKGWELALKVVILDNRNKPEGIRWTSVFNISRNRNVIESLPDNLNTDDQVQTIYGFKSRLQEGTAVGAFYGYRALGVYANDSDAAVVDFNGDVVTNLDGTPRYLRQGDANGHEFRGGDMIYEDINKDGLINELDMVQIGDANPDYQGMFRNDFNYKSWSIGIALYYNLGNDLVNGMRIQSESMTGDANQASSISRRWRKQGDITDMPRAERDATWNTLPSTRWVEDGSYLKLKEVSLSYQLPRRLITKLNLINASAWVSVSNLYTWTNYTGVDPEVGTRNGINVFGFDSQITSPPIRFTLGLRLSF